mmetsp:Transcript_31650/g.67871  ORF Transcript_31650/g.67871 Transcript_31650/m.67871 type:complete len:200 (-) Transcript_31650:594-1193(-)
MPKSRGLRGACEGQTRQRWQCVTAYSTGSQNASRPYRCCAETTLCNRPDIGRMPHEVARRVCAAFLPYSVLRRNPPGSPGRLEERPWDRRPEGTLHRPPPSPPSRARPPSSAPRASRLRRCLEIPIVGPLTRSPLCPGTRLFRAGRAKASHLPRAADLLRTQEASSCPPSWQPSDPVDPDVHFRHPLSDVGDSAAAHQR